VHDYSCGIPLHLRQRRFTSPDRSLLFTQLTRPVWTPKQRLRAITKILIDKKNLSFRGKFGAAKRAGASLDAIFSSRPDHSSLRTRAFKPQTEPAPGRVRRSRPSSSCGLRHHATPAIAAPRTAHHAMSQRRVEDGVLGVKGLPPCPVIDRTAGGIGANAIMRENGGGRFNRSCSRESRWRTERNRQLKRSLLGKLCSID
jgi:hypothetical protein